MILGERAGVTITDLSDKSVVDDDTLRLIIDAALIARYGQATIPFPIPTEEYDHVLELLEALEIGDALQRDCRVDELTSEYPILKRLKGTSINLDELDFLAKRLDSFAGTGRRSSRGWWQRIATPT